MQRPSSAFLLDFQRVCEQKKEEKVDPLEVAGKVYEELQSDFPLISDESISIFVSVMDDPNLNLFHHQFLPTNRLLTGILSILEEEIIECDDKTENDKKEKQWNQVLLVSLFLPLLRIAAQGDGPSFDKFLKKFFIPTAKEEEDSPSLENVEEELSDLSLSTESKVEEMIDSDGSDFEWESYETPCNDTFETVIEEEEVEESSQNRWGEKVLWIMDRLGPIILEMINEFHYQYKLYPLILSSVKNFFTNPGSYDPSTEGQGDCIEIGQSLFFTLQSHLEDHLEQITTLLPRVSEILCVTIDSPHAALIGSSLLILLFSRLSEVLGSDKRPLNDARSSLSKEIMKQIGLYRDKVASIRSLMEGNEEIRHYSEVLLELGRIAKALEFLVWREKGHKDSLISSRLIEGQVLQNMVLLLSKCSSDFSGDKKHKECWSSCLSFLSICSVSQSSVLEYLLRIRSFRGLLTSEEYINGFPQYIIHFYALSVLYSGPSHKNSKELTQSKDRSLEVLFSDVCGERVEEQRECLSLFVSWNEMATASKKIAVNPELTGLKEHLQQIQNNLPPWEETEAEETKKQMKKRNKISSLLKTLLSNVSSRKLD